MSPHQDSTRNSARNLPPMNMLVVALILIAAGISAWRNSQNEPPREHGPQRHATPQTESRSASHDHHQSPRDVANSSSESPASEDTDGPVYKVENQTIRDLNSRIVYEGTVDLTPTVRRLVRGESNRHRHDGTIFQNREGRLPRQQSQYYKEYVHPTPGEHGPGPQRVIIGEDGDIWYTPDHYKTFVRVR